VPLVEASVAPDWRRVRGRRTIDRPGDFISFMNSRQHGTILGSIFGIVVCGGVGGIAAWTVVALMGWDGTFGAIVAAIIGMVVATGAWTAWTSLLRMLSRTR
jgi:hypothetical protein